MQQYVYLTNIFEFYVSFRRCAVAVCGTSPV
jgi:hypothetical protein